MTVLKQKNGDDEESEYNQNTNYGTLYLPWDIEGEYFIHFFHQEAMTARKKEKENFILSKFFNS